MVKGILLLFFIAAFIVFALIKAAVLGTKEAYKAVFNPNSNDDNVRLIISLCHSEVFKLMRQSYTGNISDLPSITIQLTPVVQSILLENGYQVPREIALTIVRNAIVEGGFATIHELDGNIIVESQAYKTPPLISHKADDTLTRETILELFPNDKNIHKCLSTCTDRVSGFMENHYKDDPFKLFRIVSQLSKLVQSILLKNNYKITTTTAIAFVKDIVVSNGHATRKQIEYYCKKIN